MDITTLAAARAYTDKKVAEGGGGASGEVVDLTGVFDYVASIAQGGATCTVTYDCSELVERFKKGAVKLRLSFAGIIGEQFYNAEIIDYNGTENVRIVTLSVDQNGNLLYAVTVFVPSAQRINYTVRQISTQIYNPS